MKRSGSVRFDPSKGLKVGQYPVEELRSLLKSGYFDEAETILIGVANREAYDVRWVGPDCDALMLAAAAQAKIGRQVV